MRVRFVVDGPRYSKHKAAFKRMLADHRLAWRGNMTEFVWVGPKERVRAEYERDETRDVTVRATLTWEGKAKTPLLNELKTWVFSVGGKAEVLERCRPVLEAMGEKIVHCGPHGSGQIVKLCNQVVVGLNNLALCEALVLAAKAGVQPQRMLEAGGAGAGNSWAIANLGPKMLERDFRPGFKVEHQQKDLRLALATAREQHLPLPGTALVHQLFAAVEADGLGSEQRGSQQDGGARRLHARQGSVVAGAKRERDEDEREEDEHPDHETPPERACAP